MAGPGAPKTGGRQAGTPNKISADVRAMVLAALDRAGGEDYLLEQATANPRAFLSLVGRLLPTTRHIEARINPLEEWSDEELAAGIAALRATLVH